MPIIWRGHAIGTGYRLDMINGDLIAVEIKAVEKLLTIHEVRFDTYLKLPGYRLGLLINFNAPLIKHGILRRIWSR